MTRRRKWTAPNNPTPQAKQVWRHLFPDEPWPAGWRVEWAGFMRNVVGLALYEERRILLSYADARRPHGHVVATLVHEFVHMRSPRFRHGKQFNAG